MFFKVKFFMSLLQMKLEIKEITIFVDTVGLPDWQPLDFLSVMTSPPPRTTYWAFQQETLSKFLSTSGLKEEDQGVY